MQGNLIDEPESQTFSVGNRVTSTDVIPDALRPYCSMSNSFTLTKGKNISFTRCSDRSFNLYLQAIANTKSSAPK